ncbi:unnamed protein product [Rotaria socialis]|uniref:SCP domain-containing protein n=1 Tax=Rotaria socialis TaxID=392032 RepID=A0A821RF44_9BILA|nr:unnamed protein product [Rotaria socialis]
MIPVMVHATIVLSDFQQQALDEHNYYRQQMHCTGPMILNVSLNVIAENYAQYLAANNIFSHSLTPGLGENLYYSYSSAGINSMNGSIPTTAWYSEIAMYNFSSPGFSSATGHFTQVVWLGSTQLGIGIALTSDNRTAYVVANYYPPGNYLGQFATNVLPVCNSSTVANNVSTIVTTTATSTTPSVVSTTLPGNGSSMIGSIVLSSFQQQALDQHNYYRQQMHCTGPMILNASLNVIAENYAQYLAANNIFSHSLTPGLGENLYYSYSSAGINSMNGSIPTTAWYSGIAMYNFSSPGFSSATGAFTQVVWLGSTQLGIGIGLTSDNRTAYVVANYYPPGNYLGQFATNVLPVCNSMSYSTTTTSIPATVTSMSQSNSSWTTTATSTGSVASTSTGVILKGRGSERYFSYPHFGWYVEPLECTHFSRYGMHGLHVRGFPNLIPRDVLYESLEATPLASASSNTTITSTPSVISNTTVTSTQSVGSTTTMSTLGNSGSTTSSTTASNALPFSNGSTTPVVGSTTSAVTSSLATTQAGTTQLKNSGERVHSSYADRFLIFIVSLLLVSWF